MPRLTPTTPTTPPVPLDPAALDRRWPDGWPLRSYLELAALETAPGCAREHARAVLWEWKLGAIGDEAALVVSELVTNAVFATGAEHSLAPVRMWMLGRAGRGVLFLVWDVTMPAPVLGGTAPDAEHGRGLILVDSLSARWGIYHPDEQCGGKVIWAVLETSVEFADKEEEILARSKKIHISERTGSAPFSRGEAVATSPTRRVIKP